MHEVAQFRRRPLGVLEGFPDEVGRRLSSTGRFETELQGENRLDEALLGAVVHVALQPLPCLVGGRHDPRS